MPSFKVMSHSSGVSSGTSSVVSYPFASSNLGNQGPPGMWGDVCMSAMIVPKVVDRGTASLRQ
ncbi:hypothetical protein PENANT_c002G10469 [Penicillium antarcticum]|uniref:Uncharacterized protein n=1 Tax=Penicillium antarcticum TaxID=416450 RepID=A0A1V6QKY1_9EURO|nr:hypothetical protein PENANT_c002G10469 [Penicillium antarcticum]